MNDPLHQFMIHPLIPLTLGGIDISFTNASLFMVLATLVSTVLIGGGAVKSSLIPGRWQALTEWLYEFIGGMLEDNVGNKGQPYFPLIFSLFMFILMGNLLGMIPYAYTFTSQIIVTFGLASFMFLIITIVGIVKHRLKFFTLFFPKGVPFYMAPILIPVELLSYLSRPVSLSIRLFANMMAGHTMLKVFAGFSVALGVFGVVPIALNVILIAFEVVVAMLQAYVFTILTCIYLHDSIHLH